MQKEKQIAFPVKFGTVTFGDMTCSIPFKIDRQALKDEDALRLLVSRRLQGTIATADVSQLASGVIQKRLFEDSTIKVEGTFDTKSLGVSKKFWSSKATFALAEVEKQHLERLAMQTGIVWVDQSGDLDLEGGDAVATVAAEEPEADKPAKPAKKAKKAPAKGKKTKKVSPSARLKRK